MFVHKKVFVVDPDLSKLEETFRSQRIDEVERFNIIESFITSFETVKEVVQLTSISRMDTVERRIEFFKAIFIDDDEGNFKPIIDKTKISSEEYYEKLLGTAPEIVETKIHIKFNFRNAVYNLEFSPDLALAVAQISYTDDSPNEDWDLFSFGSLQFQDEIYMSLEETSYRRFLDRAHKQ